MPSTQRTVEVAAPAERVWQIVSDLPAMGELSPENTGGRWVKGATGPVVGARFRGANRQGRRRWGTDVVVVTALPGRAFAFSVTALGLPVAEWAYDLEPTDAGCRVTETWHDRRGGLMSWLGRVTSGVQDREGFTATSIEQTLAAVKRRAEQGDTRG